MKKMYKTGVHTFYRPRAWGDGSEEPSWGSPAQTAALSAELPIARTRVLCAFCRTAGDASRPFQTPT